MYMPVMLLKINDKKRTISSENVRKVIQTSIIVTPNRSETIYGKIMALRIIRQNTWQYVIFIIPPIFHDRELLHSSILY